ncbi:Serpentine receptor [Dirofilaria immitis]
MDLCKEANKIAHNVVLKVIYITMIIISMAAIVTEVWVMFKITNRILIHQNTRILIIVHQLWLILHCFTRIFAHTYTLIAYWKTYIDQCRYMMFPRECFMMRLPIILTSFLNAASVPTIVIERAIATYFSSRYEKFGRSIAIILTMTQASIGTGSILYIFSDFKLLDSEKIVYCSGSSKEGAPKIATILGFYATAAFISALTYPVLFSINKRFYRNKIHVNLSHRYQIMENINSLQILTPMMVFYSLFLAIYLGALFAYFAFGFKLSLKYVMYLEGAQQTPIYALTLPFAIFWTEKYIRKTTNENRQKAIELKGTEAANHYFATFERSVRRNA